MTIIQSVILGVVQGLTEFLPVSSGGHLQLGEYLLGLKLENDLVFQLVVHLATVLSTLIVFRKDIFNLIKGALKFEYNEETKFVILIIISSVPILLLKLILGDQTESIFNTNLIGLGLGFLLTAVILLVGDRLTKENTKSVNFVSAFLIGIAQTVAILPSVSRSGSTIATGLALKIKKEEVARFSFLMPIIPILGAGPLDFRKIVSSDSNLQIDTISLLAAFIAAFLAGLVACKYMIQIVKKQKLSYFAVYTFVLGIVVLIIGLGSRV